MLDTEPYANYYKPKNAYKINEHKRSARRSKRRRKVKTERSNTKDDTQSRKLTEFFTVRRSDRRTASQIKKEQFSRIESALRSSVENGIKVVQTENMGRGVFTTKKFASGDFIVEYYGELITLTTAEERNAKYKLDPTVGSFMYYFSYRGDKYCIDATKETEHMGRLVNHSRMNPNVKTRVHVDDEGTPHIILEAKTCINAGEQLFYDYGDTNKDSIKSNPWLKNT